MEGTEARRRRRRWRLRLIVWAAVSAVLAVFVAQNFITVEVRLLVGSVETRLAWALVVAALLGFLVGVLLPRQWLR